MDVDCKLGPDPLVTSLPARAIQEDVIPVLSDVPHQVVCEPEVGGGRVKQLPEFWVMDLDHSFFYLAGCTQAQVRGWTIMQMQIRHHSRHALKNNYREGGFESKKTGVKQHS